MSEEKEDRKNQKSNSRLSVDEEKSIETKGGKDTMQRNFFNS